MATKQTKASTANEAESSAELKTPAQTEEISSPIVRDVITGQVPTNEFEQPAIQPVQQTPNNEPPALTEPPVLEVVECAVLYDNIYGRHDDIIELPAEQAEAARAAGYVDTHPNAIKAIRGQG